MDDRLPAMAHVINLSHEATQRAHPLKAIRKEKVINDEVARKPVVFFYADNMIEISDQATLLYGKPLALKK